VKGERSGLLMHIAATERVMPADEKLTAFMELESAICASEDFFSATKRDFFQTRHR
jgi:hypothetical protein